ncbi:hypothetical protein L1887_17106 [Cichorium endivia]|nr:hypothetical protein L1887_17106 [Cichorium endivia]
MKVVDKSNTKKRKGAVQKGDQPVKRRKLGKNEAKKKLTYVYNVKVPVHNLKRGRPFIKYVRASHLDDIQKEEIKENMLGMRKFEKICSENFDNSNDDTNVQAIQNKYGNVEAYCAVIELGYNKILSKKINMEKALTDGLEKFPDSGVLKEWWWYGINVNVNVQNTDGSRVGEDQPEEQMADREVYETLKAVAQGECADMSATQFFENPTVLEQVIDLLEKTSEKYYKGRVSGSGKLDGHVENESVIGNVTNRVLDKGKNILNELAAEVDEDDVKGKRKVKVTQPYKSPFVKRAVSISERLKKKEINFCNAIFTSDRDHKCGADLLSTSGRQEAMEYGAGGGTDSSAGGSHHDSSDKKKRYHRHTALQIQILESTFKDCPHPDEKTRMQLSRELGLAPRQIKFWFQNRRTQMKAQHERADNCALRAENDKIRCENIVIREALKNLVCPTCGGPPIGEDCYFDEQKLRFENAQLKEELDRVSSIAAKYIGRPMLQLPPVQPIHMSSLDLSMDSYGGGSVNRMMMMNSGPSLDLDLLTGSAIGASSSTINPDPPFHSSVQLSDMDKSVMADIASNAMDELIRLVQTNEPLWTKCQNDGMDVLNLDNYKRIFSRPNDNLKNPNVRTEASKASGVVVMNSLQLVDMFVDSTKWIELFPTIVSRSRTIEALEARLLGSQSGSLQLMYEELQVLSPLVSPRQLYVLRFVQQIEQGSWAVVNVSYELPQYNPYPHSRSKVHCLPSGCLIQDMPNGYSKVTWVEHMEVEEISPIDRLYRDFIHSGLAFGARRWLASLQRACERTASLMMTGNSSHDLGGVIPSAPGKRSMMKLSQRMVKNFCSSINPSNGHQWTSVSGLNEFEVRATLHKSNDPGQPNGMVLSASTTIWLPVSPQNVFDFFRDGRTRPQWDVLSNQNPVQEVAHIAIGTHPGNCISVLRAYTPSQNNMLILQESCTDASGSLVVYCPVDLPAINIAMNGEDPSYIPLLPSGFIITTDGHHEITSQGGNGGASTSTNISDLAGDHGGTSTGSLVTVVFQIQVSSLPSAKMSPESLTTVNNLITNTVHQIKASFNSSSTTT